MPAMPVNRKELLRQLNLIRVAFSMTEISEIPLGVPKEALECPIAMALSNGWKADVSMGEVILTWRGHKGEMPEHAPIVAALKKLSFISDVWSAHRSISFYPSVTMANFIYRFDEQDFEDLILGHVQS